MNVKCNTCKGTGSNPAHRQSDNRCLWCNGKGEHANVPYPMFCLHPEKCEGKTCCPRSYACCE